MITSGTSTLPLAWGSTAWLAHIMVQADNDIAQAWRAGNAERARMIERYRSAIRDYRSALLRREPLEDLLPCGACERLVPKHVVECALVCPYCETVSALDRWSRV